MSKPPSIPLALRRGWRESMRNERWYRRCAGWVAVVSVDSAGYRLVLQRTERTFDDALAFANEILTEERTT